MHAYAEFPDRFSRGGLPAAALWPHAHMPEIPILGDAVRQRSGG